jgi:hypothetical protein
MNLLINITAFKLGWLSSVFGGAQQLPWLGPLVSALVAAGWVTFPSGMINESMAPYWIVTMWMLFGTTINLSMRWMRGRPLLASLFGFAGGPLAYIAGHKIGGIQFVDQTAAIAMLAIGWAVIMPLLMRLGERLDGISSGAPRGSVIGQRIS